MPRAEFDKTCTVWHGPLHPTTPGAFKGTADCRVVAQNGIDLHGVGAPWIAAWITMEDVEPRGGWTERGHGWNAGLGDTIAVPAGGDPNYYVVYSERIEWGEQAPYYRACVAPLPRPQSCNCRDEGGINCEEASHFVLGETVNYALIGDVGTRWWRCELPPGDYHLIVARLYGDGCEAVVNRGNSCDDVQWVIDAPLECNEFTMPVDSDYAYVLLGDVDDVVLSVGFFRIEEGPCP